MSAPPNPPYRIGAHWCTVQDRLGGPASIECWHDDLDEPGWCLVMDGALVMRINACPFCGAWLDPIADEREVKH